MTRSPKTISEYYTPNIHREQINAVERMKFVHVHARKIPTGERKVKICLYLTDDHINILCNMAAASHVNNKDIRRS